MSNLLERIDELTRRVTTATERYTMRMDAWDTIRALTAERDASRRERDALALQVLTLTNERDEARALGRLA